MLELFGWAWGVCLPELNPEDGYGIASIDISEFRLPLLVPLVLYWVLENIMELYPAEGGGVGLVLGGCEYIFIPFERDSPDFIIDPGGEYWKGNPEL